MPPRFSLSSLFLDEILACGCGGRGWVGGLGEGRGKGKGGRGKVFGVLEGQKKDYIYVMEPWTGRHSHDDDVLQWEGGWGRGGLSGR
jgi:hypothetical protein